MKSSRLQETQGLNSADSPLGHVVLVVGLLALRVAAPKPRKDIGHIESIEKEREKASKKLRKSLGASPWRCNTSAPPSASLAAPRTTPCAAPVEHRGGPGSTRPP